MFEVFKVYELAKNEKNKLFRFFCIRYVKRELKHKFFDRYRQYVVEGKMWLRPESLNEFIQFYECTNDTIVNNEFVPQITVSDDILDIKDEGYHVTAKCHWSDTNIRCTLRYDVDHVDLAFYMHDDDFSRTSAMEYYTHYKLIANDIIFKAMYNYCVSYVYGENSDLYIKEREK